MSEIYSENSLAIQWLGLCASIAGGMGSIPGQGTKILQAARSLHATTKFPAYRNEDPACGNEDPMSRN